MTTNKTPTDLNVKKYAIRKQKGSRITSARRRLIYFYSFPIVFKQILDVTAAVVLLLLFSPVFFAVYLVVLFNSPGNPIYKQQRKGWCGRPFWMYKFRTMYKQSHKMRSEMFGESDVDGIIFKMKRDPRITSVGYFLRKYSLDELPQLINVIKGNMSLVGPRPFSLEVFKRNAAAGPEYYSWLKQRHKVRPGMTGLWQVNGRNDLPFEDLVRLDVKYVNNWNMIMDLSILFHTISAVFKKRGAY